MHHQPQNPTVLPVNRIPLNSNTNPKKYLIFKTETDLESGCKTASHLPEISCCTTYLLGWHPESEPNLDFIVQFGTNLLPKLESGSFKAYLKYTYFVGRCTLDLEFTLLLFDMLQQHGINEMPYGQIRLPLNKTLTEP